MLVRLEHCRICEALRSHGARLVRLYRFTGFGPSMGFLAGWCLIHRLISYTAIAVLAVFSELPLMSLSMLKLSVPPVVLFAHRHILSLVGGL